MPVEAPFERLAQKIIPQAKLLRTWPLAGGISAQMIVFEVEHTTGRLQKMIVRYYSERTLNTHPHVADDQFRLLQVMHSSGLCTPNPLYCDPSGEIFGKPCLVLEYITGNLNFSLSNLVSAMHQFAFQLTRIHNAKMTNYDLSFLYKRSNACVEITNLPHMQMNAIMQEERIRTALSSVGSMSLENTAVLLHGDYWPGNVLWQDDKLVAVIDWEDTALGDPLIDLAISRLDLVWIFGIEAMHTFTQQYQLLMDIDYTCLPYWDLCAALRLIRIAGSDLAEWVAFFEPYGRSDITIDAFLANYQYFIDQAFEKLASVYR